MNRILIVDDTKAERDCIKALIDRFDLPLEPTEASNGREALQMLDIKRYDILLTDVKMPFMDGLELCKVALNRYPTLKAVIFSGFDEFEYAKTAISLGVKEYFLKPISPEEFCKSITWLITEIATQNRHIEHQNDNESPLSHFQGSRVETIKRYIYNNYDKDLSLDALAKVVYLHPDYLNRIYRAETGVTLNKFIKDYRMKRAMELLKSSHLKIRDICNAVGYKNYSYFCHCFRKHFGASPERIRQGNNFK